MGSTSTLFSIMLTQLTRQMTWGELAEELGEMDYDGADFIPDSDVEDYTMPELKDASHDSSHTATPLRSPSPSVLVRNYPKTVQVKSQEPFDEFVALVRQSSNCRSQVNKRKRKAVPFGRVNTGVRSPYQKATRSRN